MPSLPEVNGALCPAERGKLNLQLTHMNHSGCSVQGSSLCMNKCSHLFHLGHWNKLWGQNYWSGGSVSRNPYQGNTCFVQGAEVPHHSGGYMVNKTQLANGSGFGGALCQSKTKPLSKELLHLTLQLSELNSPHHNALVHWGLPGTNPNLKKNNKITPATITPLPYAVSIILTKTPAHLLTCSLRAILNISDVAVLLKLYLNSKYPPTHTTDRRSWVSFALC